MSKKKNSKEIKLIPDPSKILKDLEINASYITNLQQVLLFILGTCEEGNKITTAYKKLETLDALTVKIDKANENKEEEIEISPEEYPTLNPFEVSIYTVTKLLSYLHGEMIKQKAYNEHKPIEGKDYEEDFKKLFTETDDDSYQEAFQEIAQKIAKDVKANEG